MKELIKKLWFIISLLVLTGVLYSQNPELPNRNIFLGGTAEEPGHHAFFVQNFRMEAAALGYTIVDNIIEAGYMFRFDVRPNMVTYDDGFSERASRDEGLFVIMITLTRSSDGFELVSFGYTFSELDEMLNYIQYLFFRAVVNISQEDTYIPPANNYQSGRTQEEVNNQWPDRMLYLRASVDVPINIYLLRMSSDLHDKVAVYTGDIEKPDRFIPLDHKFTMVPGLTLGLDVQIFDWLSFEPLFQVGFGNPIDNSSITFSAGALLKYQFRNFRDLVLAPYGSFMYTLNPPLVFAVFPRMSAGLGVQATFRLINKQALFFDIGYHLPLGDLRMVNRFREDEPLFEPESIPYRPHSIRIAFGYKYGFLDGTVVGLFSR